MRGVYSGTTTTIVYKYMMVSKRLQQDRWVGYTKDHVPRDKGYEEGTNAPRPRVKSEIETKKPETWVIENEKQQNVAETASRRRSKQVPDPSVLGKYDVDTFSPQLVEFFESRTSGVRRNRPQISLRDNDPVQAGDDAGEA